MGANSSIKDCLIKALWKGAAWREAGVDVGIRLKAYSFVHTTRTVRNGKIAR